MDLVMAFLLICVTNMFWSFVSHVEPMYRPWVWTHSCDIYYICLCLCVHVHTCAAHQNAYVEVKEQVSVSSPLPPCGFQGQNSGHQAQQQVPLPAEPSHQPCCPLWKPENSFPQCFGRRLGCPQCPLLLSPAVLRCRGPAHRCCFLSYAAERKGRNDAAGVSCSHGFVLSLLFAIFPP